MKKKSEIRPLVLVIEDDPADQELIQRALKSGREACDLSIVSNGREALDLLRGQGPYEGSEDCRIPNLVLLDLNMPQMGGLEFLRELRADPHFHYLPVVVLTTSSHEPEVNEAYKLNCQAFITKPEDLSEYHEVVANFSNFWFKLIRAPRPPRKLQTA